MSGLEYPASWHALESPSQRYELLLTLEDDILGPSSEWNTAARDFLIDDMAARHRPESIVGGCLIDDAEQRSFFAFLDAYEVALSEGRVTEETRRAATQLLDRMRVMGVPSPAG
jgi:hypothetical protein